MPLAMLLKYHRARIEISSMGGSLTKPKTECEALSISLALKWLVGSVVGTCRVRRKQSLRWWEAGTMRSHRGGGIPLPN
jgi:hypothetical protein